MQTEQLTEEIEAQHKIQYWLTTFGVSSRYEGDYMALYRKRREEDSHPFALLDTMNQIIKDSRISDGPIGVDLMEYMSVEEGAEFWHPEPEPQPKRSLIPLQFPWPWWIKWGFVAVLIYLVWYYTFGGGN